MDNGLMKVFILDKATKALTYHSNIISLARALNKSVEETKAYYSVIDSTGKYEDNNIIMMEYLKR